MTDSERASEAPCPVCRTACDKTPITSGPAEPTVYRFTPRASVAPSTTAPDEQESPAAQRDVAEVLAFWRKALAEYYASHDPRDEAPAYIAAGYEMAKLLRASGLSPLDREAAEAFVMEWIHSDDGVPGLIDRLCLSFGQRQSPTTPDVRTAFLKVLDAFDLGGTMKPEYLSAAADCMANELASSPAPATAPMPDVAETPFFDATLGAIWRSLPWPVSHAFGGDVVEGVEGMKHMLAQGAEGERSVREFIKKALGQSLGDTTREGAK